MQTSAYGPVALRVERLTGLAELYALRNEWDELVAADPSATVFQTWEWVTSWYEHYAADSKLLVLAVRDAADRLVGLAPGTVSRAAFGVRLSHLLGRSNASTEYVNAMLHPDCDAAASRIIFDAWQQSSASWDLLILSSVPGDAPFVEHLRLLADGPGYRSAAQETVRVVRPLPESWEAFYRSLKKGLRDNTNNYVNRLRRDGHDERMVVAEDPARLDWALDVLFELHRRRALADLHPRHHDYFASPASRAFLRTAARRLAEKGAIWPCLLQLGGTPVAASICLLHAGRLYTYYSGFDSKWVPNGVMTVLTRRCIERAIEHGCRELDQIVRSDHEKLRWGGQTRPVVNLTLAAPQLRSRAAMQSHRLGRACRRLTAQLAATGRN